MMYHQADVLIFDISVCVDLVIFLYVWCSTNLVYEASLSVVKELYWYSLPWCSVVLTECMKNLSDVGEAIRCMQVFLHCIMDSDT